DKPWMTLFCKIPLAGGAVNVTPADIDFTERQEIDQLTRSAFRGITDFASLPNPTSPTNRVGDFYWVYDRLVFYFWDGSSWQALNTGSYNAETNLMNDQIERRQKDRTTNGSGIIAGTRPGDGSFAALAEVTPIETPSVADSLEIDSFSAIVNGHYIETYARAITLGIPGDRLDLIYLEVWREDIATPDLVQYGLAPDGSSTVDIQGVDYIEETLQWTATPSGVNYDFYKLEVYNHAWRIVKARFASVPSVPDIALIDPVDNTVASLATNIDGAPFVGSTPGQSDDRIWVATSGGIPVDGKSWAIPILVVRRLASENPGIGDGIKIFRNGERYVFNVHPICDTVNAGKQAVDTIHRTELVAPGDPNRKVYDQPSGFLTSMANSITPVGSNGITFYEDEFKVRIHGFEDWLDFGSSLFVGDAPPVGWSRQLLFIRCWVSLYEDDVSTKPFYLISPRRPYIPSDIAGSFRGMGWRRGFINYELVYEDLGSTDVLDEDDSMLA
ncbi:MAG: hypothetical protein MJA29_05720, partial [Candidatus Omnitrophica bacterium]|nr:hypothetical protein [Candidatus Omnitrophota bacterium]